LAAEIDAMLLTQSVAVCPAKDRLVFVDIALAMRDGQLACLHYPARFAEQGRGIDGARDYMEHGTVGETEIGGDIATLFLATHQAEGSNLLVGRDEMLVQVLADLLVRQGVLTERLRIVSGKAGLLKVAGKVQKEKKLPLFGRQPSRFWRTANEGDLGAVFIEVHGPDPERLFGHRQALGQSDPALLPVGQR
jgi:hypothetical protein